MTMYQNAAQRDARQAKLARAAELRPEAERRVIAVRGSSDVPGFEACVQAELAAMLAE